jgi:hypothetical protein
MTRLQTSRRVVPLDQLEHYLELWGLLRGAAQSVGARAWLFRDARRQDHFMEFVEHGADVEIEGSGVSEARREIDEFFGHAQVEEWEEAPEGERDV